MSFIQRQHIMVKLLLYLVAVFITGLILSIFSGLVIPTPDDIADWQFSVSYILAFIITAVAFIMAEHNALTKLKEKALAAKNDLHSIEERTENTLFQLESLMIDHMKHESDVYLKVSKNMSKSHPKLRTMGEIRSSLSEYPLLRSDETVMRLFNEISSSHNMLMNCKISYNALASDYNAGIHKFPANIFQNAWGFTELSYLNSEDDCLLSKEDF